MPRQTLNIGDTGAQLVSKFNNNCNPLTGATRALYNVLDYGAIADNSTSSINNCILLNIIHILYKYYCSILLQKSVPLIQLNK